MKPRKLSPWLAPFASIAAVLTISQTAQAQASWLGTADQDWNNVANWSTNPSNPTGAFTINLATGNYPILSANSAFNPNDVFIGNGASQSGRLDHRAGSLTQAIVGTNGNWFEVGRDGGTGTYNLADTSGTGGTLTGFAQGTGSLTVGKLWVGGVFNGAAGTGTVNINTSGTINAQSTAGFSNHGGVSIIVGTSGGSGTLNLDNGTVNAAGVVDVGSAFGATQATQGTLNISGGTFNSEGDFRTAFAGSSSALATVNLNGGTLNVGSTLKRWLILGRFDAAKSVINVAGGNLNLNTNTDIRFAQGGTGTHVINLNSGAITSYSGNQTGLGAGVVDMMQGNVAANNTFNLNGGTLTVRQVISNFSNGTRTFNFNGGTLKATGNVTGTGNAAFFNLGTGNARANVRNNGAIFDTNGFNATVAQGLDHSNIGGDNAIDGGLTKQGAGTLTLNGVNTYTGLTTISGGTLALGAAGSIDNTSGVHLGTNGTFDVSAKSGYTVNNLTGSGTVAGSVNVSTQLAIGNSPGTVNFTGDLSLTGSTYLYELVGGGTDADLGDVAGNLTLTNAILDLVQLGTYTIGDKFTLFAYDGTLTGTFDGMADDSIFTDAGGDWRIDYNDTTAGLNGGSGLSYVTITAIPEPGAALLGGLGLLALLRRRRN